MFLNAFRADKLLKDEGREINADMFSNWVVLNWVPSLCEEAFTLKKKDSN